ncbi:MAG: class I tRNA ligase family protein [Candidatus Heimdallarchaeota archaeon]|nr:class I tRNA ligase family protein [Candidatus Heimdallarchaeota archaeon]
MNKKRFPHRELEPLIRELWEKEHIYAHDKLNGNKPYIIDTPPPYANGQLHHGHGMSYTHIDIIARYRRHFQPVIFPLCFDDNGLPTEKFTEKKYNITLGNYPSNFTELCHNEASKSIETQIEQFSALGMSFSDSIAYRTYDERSHRITQKNFIELYNKGLITRQLEPQLYCITCRTALSMADLETAKRESELLYLKFPTSNGEYILIATTRPELLEACVGIFFHPDDIQMVKTISIFHPLTGLPLPMYTDDRIDMSFGSGIMMCCTFGDQLDLQLFREYSLDLISIIDYDGLFNSKSQLLNGLSISEGREIMIQYLKDKEIITSRNKIIQDVATCERCKTPIEIILSKQWSLNILSLKDELLELKKQIKWYPQYMEIRLENWIRGLRWNWIISRQRKYGIPIPAFYCNKCDNILFPSISELPVDPKLSIQALSKCKSCYSGVYIAETDVFDTWMTSSLSPQIIKDIYFPDDEELIFDLRPQAHEIIRTWTFYTMFKAYTLNGKKPWESIMLSGWGLGFKEKGKRKQKASKSSGSGTNPLNIIDEYGADVFRYWSSMARPGKDQHLDEKILIRGRKLVTKLYNACKIILILRDRVKKNNFEMISEISNIMQLELQDVKHYYKEQMDEFNYTDALKKVEQSFWKIYCSNYIEQLKKMMDISLQEYNILIKCFFDYLLLFSPFLPFITEYLNFIISTDVKNDVNYSSIHLLQFN